MQIRTSQKQMSESFWTITFLTLSGGFQDAYTYFSRGKVFANAQTGNMVLMAANVVDGDISGFLRYLFPVLAFSLGIICASLIKYRVKTLSLHWRQSVVLVELVLLLITPFVQFDFLANSLVSFACAMQLQSFRKVHGYPFASTMCIGNLRSGLDHLVCFFETKDANKLAQAFQYFRIILTFIIGAGLGKWATDVFGLYAIWGSVLLLLFAWALMFLDPHPSIPLED